MKNKLAVRNLVLLASITISLNSRAAPVTKSATGTDLTDGASWGGTAPAVADTATWTGSSLGADLTLGAAAAWQGMAITGAASDIAISGAGTLTLGSGGIDLASSAVNLSIANPLALDAAQTWKVAPGKTLTTSGIISGTAALTIGATAQSVTSTTFLTTSAQTLFTNASLASVTATSGKIGGGWVNGGTPVNATGYFLTNNGTTATYWLEGLDGGLTKGVKVELSQSGANIAARATAAKYTGSPLGYNFETGGAGAPLAISQAGDGYGANTTTLQLGYDSTGTVVLAGASTYTGPTTITRGTLKAGIVSVAGVSGAFGVDSAVSLANAANTGINLDGFDTRVGSLTGGGTTGGGIALGSATVTTGGDNTSPAAYAGVISGTGGVAKVGSGTQILSAANTYSGGTTVSGTGTLTGTAGVAFTGTQAGSFGTGSITVETGATVRSAGVFVIGGGQNTTRTLNLNGGTANITGAGAGGEYIKTINMTAGALTADSGTVFFRAPNGGGTTINSLAASTSSTISTRVDLTFGNLTASVADGAAAQDLVISANITENSGAGSGARTLTKTGDGTLLLSGTSSYSGTTAVNAGTLTVNGTLATATGSVDVAANATLSGTGTINRTVQLALDSKLRPAGAAIGTLTVVGAVNLLGKTICQIDKDATGTLTQDLLAGNSINYGGTLEVTATGEALALGDSFKLFDATTYGGGFTTFILPTLPAGLSWDLANLTADGSIIVVDFVGTPVFSPAAGGYAGAPAITLTSDSGATIYYTTDGSIPTAASTTYTDPIPLPANTVGFTLNAFARKTGQADSPVATAVYNTVDTPTWITNGNGNWSNLAGGELNWQNTVVAGGSGVVADFGTLALTQTTAVTLDGSRTIGSMIFGDASAAPEFDWSLVSNNGSALTLATTAGTPAITVNNQTTTIAVAMTGNQGLAKGGAGTLNLTSVCSYTGDTLVDAGSLLLNSSAAASQAPQLASGTINNAATVTFYRSAPGFTPVNASLSGPGDFIVDGPGGGGLYDNRLAFRGLSSDNTGTVRIINNGRVWVDLAGKNAIGDSAIVEVGPSAQFYIYQGIAETIGALAGSGNVYGGDAAGTSALTVGGGDKSADFSGVLQNQFSTLTLTKIGTGTQTLSGANTYTGNTVVSAGTLELATTGRLRFRITNTATNTLTGAGTAILKGEFAIDTSAATTGTGPWQIEDVTSLTGPYAGTFKVVNPDGSPWTDAGNNKWTKPATAGKVWTFNEATGSLTLEVSGFTSWADANAPGQTISQDHDGDGVPNGVEYFMGLSGSDFTANPAADATGKVSWPKGTTYAGTYGTDYAVQTSTGLTDWTDVPVGEVTNGNPLEFTIPTGSPARFVRLRVTGP